MGSGQGVKKFSVRAKSRGQGYLALEDVAQVAAALGAGDLRALHAEADVHMAIHRAWDLIVECRPAQQRSISITVHVSISLVGTSRAQAATSAGTAAVQK